MKLVGYLRVSTRAQVEDGFGLPVQRSAIKKWAKATGDRVVAWHSDEGLSGTKEFFDRPGLTEALQTVHDGTVEGLVISRLDRLARALTVQEAALAHVWRCGGRVFSVDGGEVLQDDPDDPMRTAMRQMVGVFGQLERAMITKRLRDGRRHKASTGGYAHGAPGLGFVAVDGKLIRDSREQTIVARIIELQQQGASLRDIAIRLEEEEHRPKRSEKWHPETIRRVLARASLG